MRGFWGGVGGCGAVDYICEKIREIVTLIFCWFLFVVFFMSFYLW